MAIPDAEISAVCCFAVGAGRNPERCVVVMYNAHVTTLFLKRTKIIMATGKRQIRRFHRPHWGLTTPQPETPSNIYTTNDLYCQKVDSFAYIFAADCIGLCLLLFTKLSLKVEPSESKTATTKSEFYML